MLHFVVRCYAALYRVTLVALQYHSHNYFLTYFCVSAVWYVYNTCITHVSYSYNTRRIQINVSRFANRDALFNRVCYAHSSHTLLIILAYDMRILHIQYVTHNPCVWYPYSSRMLCVFFTCVILAYDMQILCVCCVYSSRILRMRYASSLHMICVFFEYVTHHLCVWYAYSSCMLRVCYACSSRMLRLPVSYVSAPDGGL